MSRIVMIPSFVVLGVILGCSPTPVTTAAPQQVKTEVKAEEAKPDADKRVKTTRPGNDWPRYLGPNLDGTSAETGILKQWPKEGLKKLWECKMGQGYSAPVIAKGKLYHFDRFADNATLTARNAETGEFLWKYEYATEYEDLYGYDPGPRASPIVDDDRVYIYGADGFLICIQASDGKEVWKVDTKKTYKFHQNFFGVGSTPIVDGDLVIVAVGGSPKGARPFDLRDAKGDGTGIVAFNKKTGEEKYRVSNELASYSSPIIATIHGKKVGIYFSRNGLLGFDPQTGKELFTHKWRAKILESVNAANPVVIDDKIFLTECYEIGSIYLQVNKDMTLKEIWSDKDAERGERALMGHWCTPIRDGNFLYGCSGRHTTDSDIRCIDLTTGKMLWSEPKTTRATFVKIDGHILSLAEEGSLTLFKLNEKKFDKVAQWKEIPDMDFPCWAPPVVSHGIVYIRGKSKLVAYELIPVK